MDGEKLILTENLEDEIKFEGKIVCFHEYNII
jgi:hypothetical protein